MKRAPRQRRSNGSLNVFRRGVRDSLRTSKREWFATHYRAVCRYAWSSDPHKSQKRFAAEMGVSRTQIANICGGARAVTEEVLVSASMYFAQQAATSAGKLAFKAWEMPSVAAMNHAGNRTVLAGDSSTQAERMEIACMLELLCSWRFLVCAAGDDLAGMAKAKTDVFKMIVTVLSGARGASDRPVILGEDFCSVPAEPKLEALRGRLRRHREVLIELIEQRLRTLPSTLQPLDPRVLLTLLTCEEVAGGEQSTLRALILRNDPQLKQQFVTLSSAMQLYGAPRSDVSDDRPYRDGQTATVRQLPFAGLFLVLLAIGLLDLWKCDISPFLIRTPGNQIANIDKSLQRHYGREFTASEVVSPAVGETGQFLIQEPQARSSIKIPIRSATGMMYVSGSDDLVHFNITLRGELLRIELRAHSMDEQKLVRIASVIRDSLAEDLVCNLLTIQSARSCISSISIRENLERIVEDGLSELQRSSLSQIVPQATYPEFRDRLAESVQSLSDGRTINRAERADEPHHLQE